MFTSCLNLCLLIAWPAPAQRTPPPASFAQLSTKADAARDANRLDEAVPLYRKALALRPAWREGWWSLATILYDQNSYAPAARAFTKAVALDPKNGTAHLMLALCQYELRQDDRAIANIKAARALGIRDDDQLERVLEYHEGLLLLRKRDYERAIDAFKSLVVQGVNSEDLDFALGLAVLLIDPKTAPPEGSPDRQIVLRAGRAEHLSLLKRYDEAKQAYSDLAREFPDFRNVHYAFGRYFLAVREPESALPQFQEEINRQPSHIRARMQIAAVKYRVDSPGGVPYAAEVVKLDPAYPFGHYMLGLLYFDSGDTQRAIPQLETAVRMVPTEAQFYFALGTAYAKVGRKADAARVRATFRKLDADTKVVNAPNTYGDQAPTMNHAPGPAPQSSETKHP
jgi:tetratricopeptide (TPR) repeat protein